jgi:Helix-turn-helix domain
MASQAEWRAMTSTVLKRRLQPFVDEREAAKKLNLNVATLRNWRWRGCGPAWRKFGASVRYGLDDLSEFAESGRRTPTNQVGSR